MKLCADNEKYICLQLSFDILTLMTERSVTHTCTIYVTIKSRSRMNISIVTTAPLFAVVDLEAYL